MKIGRNDPCLCGSGKKFKKCCLEKEQVSDLEYRRLSNAQQKLVDKITKYVVQDLGENFLDEALIEFFQDDSDTSIMWQEVLSELSAVFWPWLFYNFELAPPDIEEAGLIDLIRPNTTVAEMFRQDKRKKLDSLEWELLSAANRIPFSFFEVDEVHPGQGFQVVNLLTGRRQEVNDVSGSKGLERGDITYSLIIEVRGYAISIGNASYKFYPRFKPRIIQFRKDLEEDYGSVNNEVLRDADYEFRDLFLTLYYSLFESPELCNTDGDPLSFRTLHYEIASPEEAFRALAPLCIHATEEGLRAQAELNAKAQVHKVQFAWSREGHTLSNGLDNTTLGQISIKGNQMTIEVNSGAREDRIKEEIDKRLGDRAAYKVTDIRSPDSVLAEGASAPSSAEPDEEQEALQNAPEVQEAMKEMLARHWQGWVDTELPALGGKTPRQAVHTADGREAVHALLRDIEVSDTGSGMPVSQQPYLDWVRKELGLPDT